MFQLKRAIISLSLMLAFMIVLEIVRMGLANDSKYGINIVDTLPLIVSASEDLNYSSLDYLILYDNNETNSIYAKTNYEELFKFYKINVEIKDTREYIGDYRNYKGVFIAFADWALINNIPSLINYVEQGGNVAFIFTPLFEGTYNTLSSPLGIIETGDPLPREGIITQGDFLICGNDVRFEYPSILNYAYQIQLNDNCEVLLRSFDNTPLLWKTNKGNGMVVVCNNDLTKSKHSRGLVTGIIALFEKDFLYPVANSWVTFLTAFPTSSNSTNNAYIRKLYALDTNSFIRNMWWPDMLRLSRKYNIYYTSVFVQNYTANVEPPFYQEGLTKNDLIGVGSDILRSKGEIGFNGYNFRPLGLEGDFKLEGWFVPWVKYENMVLATKEVVSFTKEAFPNYILRTYAPPAGQLSPDGRRAVIEGCPTVKVISGLYESNWGNQLVQDFKKEQDGTISFPRVANGFIPETGIQWDLSNSAEAFGIVSHDIDMIEILFPDGEDYKWNIISKMLTDLIEKLRTSYKFIEPQTASNAAQRVERLSQLKITQKKDDKGIYYKCFDFTANTNFILRTQKAIKTTVGCSTTKINNNSYLVTAQTPDFSILWS